MPSTPGGPSPGPLQRTAEELRRIQSAAAFSRARVTRSRALLRESDGLLAVVEECRVRGFRLLPAAVHSAVVRLLRRVDRDLRDELGINRHPDRVSDILFQAQEALLERANQERFPALAPIIPLFPSRGVESRRIG